MENKILKKLEERLETQYKSWGYERMQPTKTFILERSKQWSEVTGIPYYEIIDRWLDDCHYSMINYFQNCNQPKLDEKTRVFETLEDYRNSVGKKGFRCPYCKGISTDPYRCNSGLEVGKRKKEVCDWTSYGLFGTLGKGIFVFVKENMRYANIFYPIAWEELQEKGK